MPRKHRHWVKKWLRQVECVVGLSVGTAAPVQRWVNLHLFWGMVMVLNSKMQINYSRCTILFCDPLKVILQWRGRNNVWGQSKFVVANLQRSALLYFSFVSYFAVCFRCHCNELPRFLETSRDMEHWVLWFPDSIFTLPKAFSSTQC